MVVVDRIFLVEMEVQEEVELTVVKLVVAEQLIKVLMVGKE